MSLNQNVLLFEDTFVVTAVDPEGKKFDKVSRIISRSENFDCELILDYHCLIYKLVNNQRFTLLLTRTLSPDGTIDSAEYNQSHMPTLADSYEYVMHGKVFKVSAGNAGIMECYVSYGGLLMCLKGEARNLSKFELDQRVYLLIRKIK